MTKQKSVLNMIAHIQGRRDEVPNQQLAAELARTKNRSGIREIADNLRNEDPHIQADCLKVLYEIGYREPALVAKYVSEFIGLLSSKNNRLVWGAMIALSTVAGLRATTIGRHLEEIAAMMKNGSVITVDNAVGVLAVLAAKAPELRKQVMPILFEHLRTCRPKDIPQRANRMLVAVAGKAASEFISLLDARRRELTPSQLVRIRKVIAAADGK